MVSRLSRCKTQLPGPIPEKKLMLLEEAGEEPIAPTAPGVMTTIPQVRVARLRKAPGAIRSTTAPTHHQILTTSTLMIWENPPKIQTMTRRTPTPRAIARCKTKKGKKKASIQELRTRCSRLSVPCIGLSLRKTRRWRKNRALTPIMRR
jgi:hypothetical protein